MQWLLIALAAITVFYIAPCIVIFILTFYGRYDPEAAMKKKYFIPYRREIDEASARLGSLRFEPVSIEARDGTTLRGKYYRCGSDKLAILVHGYNASAMSNFCVSGLALYDRGYSLLMIDERAHGESGGRKTGFGLLERYDVLTWLDWAEKNAAEKSFFIYGISMGSAALAFSADKLDEVRVKALCFDCGFVSPREQMRLIAKKHHIPGRIMIPFIRILAKIFIGEDINDTVIGPLSRSKIPSVFMYGGCDRTIPMSDGREYFAASAAPKLMLIAPEAEHTMCFIAGGEEIRKPFFDFIDKYVK